MGLFGSLGSTFLSSLYILDISPLLDLGLVKILSQSVGCHFVLSKWIKDLHIKPDTLKLIDKKLGKTLEDISTGEKFLNRTPIVYALRSRIDRWEAHKITKFL